jgi:hypothetical protein
MSTDSRINNLHFVYTMEYFTLARMNQYTQRQTSHIILKEKNQHKQDTLYTLVNKNFKTTQTLFMAIENKTMVTLGKECSVSDEVIRRAWGLVTVYLFMG